MRQFIFPGENGFALDIDTRKWAPVMENDVIFRLHWDALYLYYQTMGLIDYTKYRILGWNRIPFPMCCGLDIVSELTNTTWPIDIMEKWWNWMKTMQPLVKPAIGIVPQLINGDNSKMPIDIYYSWYASKGVQWGDPIKNLQYPNHQLIPYLFFPSKGIEKILKPTFGMFNLLP